MSKAESASCIDIDRYAEGVRAGDRTMLARAITLIESRKADHQEAAQALLQKLLPDIGDSIRIGITGPPGVGKSTLIDQLGIDLTARGNKIAVLAVDPSSARSGGSILGDKTRMARLSQDPNAYIRPSPSSGALGGVAKTTRETIALVEAAGFDIVLVETVGIGQSETEVGEMVDFFLALMLPGAGDDLQGIKRGVLELADMIVVTKADSDNLKRARHAASDYKAALNILTPASPNWTPPVLLVSAVENTGLAEMWATIEKHRKVMEQSGERAEKRADQAISWMHRLIEMRIQAAMRRNPEIANRLPDLEQRVRDNTLTPALAATQAFDLLGVAGDSKG